MDSVLAGLDALIMESESTTRRLQAARREAAGRVRPRLGTGDSAAEGRRRRRRRRGGRAAQVARVVEAHPEGIGGAAIAKELKVGPNYVYRVLGHLARDGEVRKEGRVYFPPAAPV